MSKPGPSARAASSTSDRSTLTPTLMFAANTIGIARAMVAQRGFLRVVEPGGADDGGDAVPRARGKVRERARRTREVDEDVGRATAASTSEPTDHAGTPTLAGVASDAQGFRRHRVRRQARARVVREHGFDQRLAHASAGAGDRDLGEGAHWRLLPRAARTPSHRAAVGTAAPWDRTPS